MWLLVPCRCLLIPNRCLLLIYRCVLISNTWFVSHLWVLSCRYLHGTKILRAEARYLLTVVTS